MNPILLRRHLDAAPLMEPTDVLKLAYQHAYGCGHLLPSRDECAARIEEELARTPEDPSVPAAVRIGGGLCRLNLAAPAVRAAGADRIVSMMIATDGFVRARGKKRNQELLEETLRQVSARKTPFGKEAWESWLEGWRACGSPVVSHSSAYREAYHPAYRVVWEAFAMVLGLLDKPLVVFDGPCGSGKSSLAAALSMLQDSMPVSMDDFFLPPDMRTPERLAMPGGNVYAERFEAEVLGSLLAGGEVCWNAYDCQTGRLTPCSRKRLPHMIIEGSYSHHPAFEKAYEQLQAFRVYVDVEEQDQLRRLQHRDPELFAMFQNRWIPLEKTYFEAYDIRRKADAVLVNDSWDADGLFLRNA